MVLAAGLAALVATVVSWFMTWAPDGGARPALAVSIQAFSLKIAFTFLPAAFGASLLMPSTADLTRSHRPGEETSASAIVTLLLAGLAAAAVLQAPSLVGWWTADRVLLNDATGNGADPLGLNIIPRVVLFSMPTLAAAALVTFVLTSILGILVRAELAFHVLSACAALQAGLVVGEHLILHEMRAIGAKILPLFATAPDPTLSAQVAEWFARHDAAGSDVSWRLAWILGGYLIAAAIAEYVSPRRRRAQPGATATSESDEPATIPAARILPPVSSTSSAASAFDDSNYSVRPRLTLLGLVLQSHSDYDIQSIPPMSRARFSFTWKTGIVRREPDGPDLLALRRSEGQGLFGARSHTVIDVGTGAALGTLRPSARDWEIIDSRGDLIARVLEGRADSGFAGYVAKVNEQVVCRFTWALLGLSVQSAELDVEFLPGSDARFDRAFAIALAPILEHQARMARARGFFST